jgi:hypothetical protein
VRLAEGDERLTAGHRARTGERIERRDGELRLGQGQPSLGAQAGVPAGRRRVEAPALLIEREQQQRERVGERHPRKLGREPPRGKEVAPVESALELAVRAPLRGSGTYVRILSSGTGGADRALLDATPSQVTNLAGRPGVIPADKQPTP